MVTMPSLCCQTAKKAHSVSSKYQKNEQNQINLQSLDRSYISCYDAVPLKKKWGQEAGLQHQEVLPLPHFCGRVQSSVIFPFS